jgi:XRE family transcriptional regulator, regulator of sulfur utilization
MPATTSRNPTLALAFGQTVRAAREAKGVAQEWMALDAEIDRSYFGQLERGEKQPSLDLTFRIAAVLGVSPELLVKGVRAHYEKTLRSHARKPVKNAKQGGNQGAT